MLDKIQENFLFDWTYLMLRYLLLGLHSVGNVKRVVSHELE